MKAFFPRINYKISTNKLREIFNEIDTRKRTEIGFDDFAMLYQKVVLDEKVSFTYVCTLVELSKIFIFRDWTVYSIKS